MLIFRRPEKTAEVLAKVKEINPEKLYVVADGPRTHRPDDIIHVEKTRALFKQLPETIQLHVKLREKNIGLRASVEDGLNWFFENEEMGIILEDDCLPEDSFFYFTKELLYRYKDNKKIMHICGSNFQSGIQRGESEASYFFSNLPQVWGWATWRRAWKYYDPSPEKLKEFLKSHHASDFGYNWFYFYKHKQFFIRAIIKETLSSWAYIWHFSIWYNGGLGISPNKNLTKNIGIDSDATHTAYEDDNISKIETEEMPFPLIHPKEIKADSAADNVTLGIIYGKNWRERIKKRIQIILLKLRSK